MRYCWLIILSLNEDLLLAWYHNINLLNYNNIELILRFMILLYTIVKRFIISKIGIFINLNWFFIKVRIKRQCSVDIKDKSCA